MRTAAKIFFEKGYRATTLREIGAAMEFSSAALYYYVENKQELLRDIIMEPSRRLVRIAAEEYRIDKPLLERLRKIIYEHVQFMLTEREVFGVMDRERIELDEESEVILNELEREYFQIIRELIRAANENGEISIPDPVVAALGLIGMINWTTRWYNADGRYTPAEISSLFYDQFLLGAAPRAQKVIHPTA